MHVYLHVFLVRRDVLLVICCKPVQLTLFTRTKPSSSSWDHGYYGLISLFSFSFRSTHFLTCYLTKAGLLLDWFVGNYDRFLPGCDAKHKKVSVLFFFPHPLAVDTVSALGLYWRASVCFWTAQSNTSQHLLCNMSTSFEAGVIGDIKLWGDVFDMRTDYICEVRDMLVIYSQGVFE